MTPVPTVSETETPCREIGNLPPSGGREVNAIVSVSVMFLILARCRDLTDSLGWEKCQACITSLIIAAWAIGLLWLSTTTGTEPQYLTFTEKTERTFNVSHLRCENIGGCPSKKLPEDRTEATWLQGNRYVKGWITCGRQQSRSRWIQWNPING